jgi:hypothetical protein
MWIMSSVSLTHGSCLFCFPKNSKENTVLRAALDPQMVSVIPNAVITDNFRPAFQRLPDPDHRMLLINSIDCSRDCRCIPIIL